MALRILNTAFDSSTEEIIVDVEGSAPVWINLDSLISQYHGAGTPTKESIGAAIGKWLMGQQAGVRERRRNVEDAVRAVGMLKGKELAA